MSRQLTIVPNWSLTAAAGTTRAINFSPSSLFVGNGSDTQTSSYYFSHSTYPQNYLNKPDANALNWLHRQTGDNLATLRDYFGFSIFASYATPYASTTAAAFADVRAHAYTPLNICIFGRNVAANAIEGYNSSGQRISDGIPAGGIHQLIDVVQSSNGAAFYAMALSSNGATKLYSMTLTPTSVADVSSYLSSTAASLRRLRHFIIDNASYNNYLIAVGDSGNIFTRAGTISTFTKQTLPSGLTGINFKDACFIFATSAADKGYNWLGNYYGFVVVGDSRTIGVQSVTGSFIALTAALPSSLSAAYCVEYNEMQNALIVGGVRNDGIGFIGYSYDMGKTFTEVDTAAHGIVGTVISIRKTAHGAFMAAVSGSGALYAGFADDLQSWKQVGSYGWPRIESLGGTMYYGEIVSGGQTAANFFKWGNGNFGVYNRRPIVTGPNPGSVGNVVVWYDDLARYQF